MKYAIGGLMGVGVVFVLRWLSPHSASAIGLGDLPLPTKQGAKNE